MRMIGVFERENWRTRFSQKLSQPFRRGWTPFDKDGYLDEERLKAEGWTMVGALEEEAS